jgi:hypothetical protein
MFYVSIGLIFLFFTQITQKKNVNQIFAIGIIFLLIISAIRYGIGDYFTYFHVYNLLPSTFNSLSSKYFYGFEPGYSLLCILCKLIGLNFSGFIIIHSILLFVFHTFFIKKYSKSILFSLFLLFSGYYLMYILGVLRQGIAMVFFLFAYLKYLSDKNYIKYIIFILLATLFHGTALFFLIIPIISKIFSFKTLSNPFFLIISSMVLFFCSFFVFQLLIIIGQKFIPKLGFYVSGDIVKSSFSIMALCVRVLLLILIYICVSINKKYMSYFDEEIYKLYIIGFLLYLIICQIGLLTRMSDYFSMIEIILIPNILTYFRSLQTRKTLKAFFVLVFLLLFLKDIRAFQVNDKHISKNLLEFPYITIFNKIDMQKHLKATIDGRFL